MNITFIRKYPVATYFGLTFFISWTGASLLVANKIMKNEPLTTLDGIMMFPIMLLGPALSGILMNYALGKRSAVRDLFRSIKLSRTKNTWLLSLFIPPLLIFIALFVWMIYYKYGKNLIRKSSL